MKRQLIVVLTALILISTIGCDRVSPSASLGTPESSTLTVAVRESPFSGSPSMSRYDVNPLARSVKLVSRRDFETGRKQGDWADGGAIASIGRCFNSPKLQSTNKSLNVMCVGAFGPPRKDQPDVLVVSDDHNNELFRKTLPGNFRVKSLAWAPDSKYIAILTSQESTSLAFFDALALIFGQQVPKEDFYVQVYDLEGRSLSIPIAKNVRYGIAKITEWR